jgi:hypothetical protein
VALPADEGKWGVDEKQGGGALLYAWPAGGGRDGSRAWLHALSACDVERHRAHARSRA